jgi:hypothetical protein
MLKFHPDKCKTMRIGCSKVEKHEYTLKADLKPMEETGHSRYPANNLVRT